MPPIATRFSSEEQQLAGIDFRHPLLAILNRHPISTRSQKRLMVPFRLKLVCRVAYVLFAIHVSRYARADHTAARLWNEQLLRAISLDTGRPTVHARNLFHLSTAMYDAWAAYDSTVQQYVHLSGGIHPPADDFAGRRIGRIAGPAAWNLAMAYFNGTAVPEPASVWLLLAGAATRGRWFRSPVRWHPTGRTSEFQGHCP